MKYILVTHPMILLYEVIQTRTQTQTQARVHFFHQMIRYVHSKIIKYPQT